MHMHSAQSEGSANLGVEACWVNLNEAAMKTEGTSAREGAATNIVRYDGAKIWVANFFSQK